MSAQRRWETPMHSPFWRPRQWSTRTTGSKRRWPSLADCAFKELLDLPHFLALHGCPERHRQSLDMRPSCFGEAHILHAAKRPKYALACHDGKDDHQRGDDQRHAKGDGQVAEARKTSSGLQNRRVRCDVVEK
jgi:hypothetical protein